MGVDYIYFETLPQVQAHLIVNTVLTFLATGCVCLRIVTRFMSGARLWWDDYLIIASVPQGIGMLVLQGMYSKVGVGYPITETLPNLKVILQMLVAYELIFSVAISTIKLSVMMFYLRVFVNQGLRLAVKLVMAFVGLWSLGNILQVFLICRPFAATYDPLVKGECGNQVASFIAIGAFNVVTDVLILTLPIRTVWGLSMSVPAKVGLTGVFLIGLIVSIVSIIRIHALTQLDLTNLTGTMIWADFWSCFEINSAILCVSMPMLGTMWPLCTTTRSKLGASSGNGTGGYASGYGTSSSARGFDKLKNKDGSRSRPGLGDGDSEEFVLDNIYVTSEVHVSETVDDGGSLNSKGMSGESRQQRRREEQKVVPSSLRPGLHV